jgi:hypothetical protein
MTRAATGVGSSRSVLLLVLSDSLVQTVTLPPAGAVLLMTKAVALECQRPHWRQFNPSWLHRHSKATGTDTGRKTLWSMHPWCRTGNVKRHCQKGGRTGALAHPSSLMVDIFSTGNHAGSCDCHISERSSNHSVFPCQQDKPFAEVIETS